MSKCLVTTLKAQTNNEELSKYNVLTIKTKASNSLALNTQWISFGASNNGSVSLSSTSVGLYKSGISGELLSYPISIQANTEFSSHFENKTGIIEVACKYNISKILLGDNATVRMKEIYGIPGTINRLNISIIEEGVVDVNKLKNTLNISKITELLIKSLNSSSVVVVNKLSKDTIREFKALAVIDTNARLFDGLGIDDISNNVNIEEIYFYNLIGGNLSSLAKMTKLKKIFFLYSVQNTGDIMDFINPWIQAGRTSGKFNVVGLLTQKNITLNGQPITYPSGVKDNNAYLNWTSDGTVTFTAR